MDKHEVISPDALTCDLCGYHINDGYMKFHKKTRLFVCPECYEQLENEPSDEMNETKEN